MIGILLIYPQMYRPTRALVFFTTQARTHTHTHTYIDTPSFCLSQWLEGSFGWGITRTTHARPACHVNRPAFNPDVVCQSSGRHPKETTRRRGVCGNQDILCVCVCGVLRANRQSFLQGGGCALLRRPSSACARSFVSSIDGIASRRIPCVLATEGSGLSGAKTDFDPPPPSPLPPSREKTYRTENPVWREYGCYVRKRREPRRAPVPCRIFRGGGEGGGHATRHCQHTNKPHFTHRMAHCDVHRPAHRFLVSGLEKPPHDVMTERTRN
ncbi:hypothetical protein LZ30DRAFT_144625 [Colletotrichum cereale]|nr:hypothetical protein LZ30DRAFT_144625 [Colletotrichum cereale]